MTVLDVLTPFLAFVGHVVFAALGPFAGVVLWAGVRPGSQLRSLAELWAVTRIAGLDDYLGRSVAVFVYLGRVACWFGPAVVAGWFGRGLWQVTGLHTALLVAVSATWSTRGLGDVGGFRSFVAVWWLRRRTVRAWSTACTGAGLAVQDRDPTPSRGKSD